MPSSGYWGSQSLGESPVPRLSVRVESAKRNTQGLCPIPSSFLTPVPWTHPSCCNTTLGRVLSSIGGMTLRKEAGGGNPNTRRHETHIFSKFFQSRGSTSFGCSRNSFTASGGCGLMQRGRGSPGPCDRAHWLAHLPQLHQPHDSPSLGNKPAQASGIRQQPRSPRPEGNRVGFHSL